MEKIPSDFKDVDDTVKSMYKQTMAAYQEHVLNNPPKENTRGHVGVRGAICAKCC